ncbi:MAG: NUDIX hydrolase [Candidatus Bathyarchaeia archaeon]
MENNKSGKSSDIHVLGEGRYLKLVSRDRWEYVERKGISGIVLILPITEDNQVVLVEQYRYPVQGNVIELCAGLVGDIPGQERESLLEAAKRELEEECGYQADGWKFLLQGPPAQGLCNEILTFFLAYKLKKVGTGGGDETENLIVHHIPLSSLHQWLRNQEKRGKWVDPKIYTALYFWEHRDLWEL